MKKETLEKLLEAVKECLAEIKTPEKVRPRYGDSVDLNKLLRDPVYALRLFDGATIEIITEYGETIVSFADVDFRMRSGIISNARRLASPAKRDRPVYETSPMFIRATMDGDLLWVGAFQGGFPSTIYTDCDVVLEKGNLSIGFQ